MALSFFSMILYHCRMRSPTATVPAIFCHIEWRLMQIICQGATKSKLLNEVDSKARLCRRTPLNTHFACWEAHKRDSGPPPDPSQHAFACWEAPKRSSRQLLDPSQHAICMLRGPPKWWACFRGPLNTQIACWEGSSRFFLEEKYHNISNSLILATHSIKTSATSFSADPSRFRFLSALMSECRQMKMNKCFWHFLVFEDLTGRPSGKKSAMSKDQKILWERNHTVKRIKENVLCLRFLYTVKRITLWKKVLW